MIQTHFEIEKKYIPISGGKSIHVDADSIYSFNNKTFYHVQISTGKILATKKFSTPISFLHYHENEIYFGFVNGSIAFLSNKKTLEFHLATVTSIITCNNYLITASIDQRIIIIDKSTCKEVKSFKGIAAITCLSIHDNILYAGDYIGNIYLIDLELNTIIRTNIHQMYVSKILLYNDSIYSISYDGSLSRITEINENNSMKKIDFIIDEKDCSTEIKSMFLETKNIGFRLCDIVIHDYNLCLVGDSSEIFIMDFNLNHIIRKKIQNDNGFIDNVHYNRIIFHERIILITEINEIIFVDENFRYDFVIPGNIEEITEIIEYNEVYIVSSNIGHIYIFSKNDEYGNFCYKSQILQANNEPIMSMCLENDKLFTSSRDGIIRGWNIIRKNSNDVGFNKIYSFKSLGQIQASDHSINSVSVCGNLFFCVGADKFLKIYNTSESEFLLIHSIQVHSKEINSVSVNKKHQILVTSSMDKTSKVISFDGKEMATLRGHKKGVWCCDVDDNHIVTGSADETIRIWDIKTYECLKVLEGQNSSIIKLKIFNDNSQLISNGNDGTLKIWDLNKGKIVGHLNTDNEKSWAVTYKSILAAGNIEGIITVFKNKTFEYIEKEEIKQTKIKTNQFLIDKHMKVRNYIEAFKITYEIEDFNNAVECIANILKDQINLNEMFDFILKDQQKAMKFLTLVSKHNKKIEIFHLILEKYLLRYCVNVDETKNIQTITGKHINYTSQLLNDFKMFKLLFRDLLLKDI